MNRKLAIVTAGIYLGIAALIFSVSAMIKEKPVRASVFPLHITAGGIIHFSDSTENASSVLWEFGNGEKSRQKKGSYKFDKAGSYLVKLTVNESKQITFPVEVIQPAVSYQRDSTVFIYANSSGIVTQKIHFKAMGQGIEWCEWYFGETGKVDARTPETFYSFNKPGTYEVKLITNLNYKKPERHKVVILPGFEVTENIVLAPKEKSIQSGGGGSGKTTGNELLDRIQAIARGENFNSNYSYVVHKLLCSNPNVPVTVNQKQITDFYSYCQSLQIKAGQTVLNVTTEKIPGSNCISKLIIKHQ